MTERYGREHAALVAAFSTYHSRGAIRGLGKALGLPAAELERLARVTEGNPRRVAEEVERLPGDHASARWRALGTLAHEIAGLPRHISQHPGGMVISSRPLVELVPVQDRGDGGAPDLPVGQGLVRRRRFPEDRPARSRDALRRRGLRRPDRPSARHHDRPLADPARRPGGVRRDPACRHHRRLPDRESRADAEPAAHTAGEPRRPDDPGRARPAGADPGRGGPPYIERRQKLREDPSYVPPVDHPSLAEPLRETLCVVVFQDQVLEVAMALAASPSARPRGCVGR